MSFDHLEVRRELQEVKAKIDSLLSYMDTNQLEPDRTVVDDEICSQLNSRFCCKKFRQTEKLCEQLVF